MPPLHTAVPGERCPLRLELARYDVTDVRWGPRTALERSGLTLDRAALERLLLQDARLAAVALDLARPGEAVRVIHVVDLIEPRAKTAGGASIFPGLLGPVAAVGQGRTHRLAGVGVLIAAALPEAEGGLSIKEAIVDFSGPAARYSPAACLQTVVLTVQTRSDLPLSDACLAIRLAGLRLAAALADVSRDLVPDHVDVRELAPPADPDLPRVVYILPFLRDGSLFANDLYGRRQQAWPTWLHPNELLDGALVPGDYMLASTRTSTYSLQNNPVVEALWRRHGHDLNFLGVLLARSHVVDEADKTHLAWQAAKQAHLAGAQGAVISMLSGGHGYADLHLISQSCERFGIRTVVLQAELGDDEGSDLGLIVFAPESDAIVSVGNQDEVVAFPPLPRVLGGDTWSDMNNYEGEVGAQPAQAFRSSLRRVFQSTDQCGSGAMTARPS